MKQIIFHPDQIQFRKYSLKIASVSKKPMLNAADIKEVRLERWPLEVVTNAGEIIFISGYYDKHLSLFARVNNLPIVHRTDVWSWLNEPFLDTEFGESAKQGTMRILQESGFSSEEVSALRKKISTRMLRYNSFLWEWISLGHYDVLSASGYNFPIQLFGKKVKAQYDEFNAISNRGKITDPLPISTEEKIRIRVRGLASDIIPFEESEWSEKKKDKSDVREKRENLALELVDLITSNHDQKHRHYHTLEHVLNVVEYCDNLYFRNERNSRTSLALRLAAFFHDIVYEPNSDKNEETSANLMCSKLEKWVNSKDLKTASNLILMTKSHFKAKSRYEKILSDADLSILAEEESIYKKYAYAVRQEYSHMSDGAFNSARIEFLETVLKNIRSSGNLFHYLHPLYESQALKNITTELKQLA